jgi:hypothetical protein
MQDPSCYLDIALANRLNPPYLTDGAKIPFTLSPGDTILIPVASGAGALPSATSRLTGPAESSIEELMGVDCELVQVSKERYGWAIDEAHGSEDARLVSRMANYKQALESRMRTVQGEDVLNPSVGIPRLVGAKQMGDTGSEAILRIRQQVMADPRTEQFIGVSFRLENDALTCDITVKTVGGEGPRVIPATI